MQPARRQTRSGHCHQTKSEGTASGRASFHGFTIEPPEPSVEGDSRLSPQRFHQRQTLVEPSHQAVVRINLERREQADYGRRCRPDLQTTVAQLVQRSEALGQMDRLHGSEIINTTHPNRNR